jgi:hypothetical protein
MNDHILGFLEFTPTDFAQIAESISVRRIRAIYFFVEDGQIVYIGQSKNLWGRLLNHPYYKSTFQVGFIEIPDNIDLNIVESFYIQKFRPRLNVSHGPIPARRLAQILKSLYAWQRRRVRLAEKEVAQAP